MKGYQTTEHEGVIYREVNRKANVGELVKITEEWGGDQYIGNIVTVIEPTDEYVGDDEVYTNGFYEDGSTLNLLLGEYVVLELIGDAPKEEPTPQLAGIHDSLAKLALEITELKRKIDANSDDIAFLDEKRLTAESLTPLQLAILNAKDTPAETKLALIVEAGRLEEQRKETVKNAYHILFPEVSDETTG
jgi:hypothetical protein